MWTLLDGRHWPEVLKQHELEVLEPHQRRPILMSSEDAEGVFAAYDQVKMAINWIRWSERVGVLRLVERTSDKGGPRLTAARDGVE